MNRKMKLIVIASLLLTFAVSPGLAKIAVDGSVYAEGYGYEIPIGGGDTESHLWLTSGVSSTVKNLPKGIQFHSHFQYRGDNEDKFAESGDMHLYSAYFSYGDWGSPLEMNVGRFFAYRGVAWGMLDGVEISHQALPWFGWAVLGGNNGPDNRRFELAKGSSPFVGAELRFRFLKSFMKYENNQIKLSYANQKRDGEEFRNLVGLQMYTRYNKRWTELFTIQYRPTSGDLRYANYRERFYSPKFTYLFEAGVFSPEIASTSWFKDFELESTWRFRGAFDYYFVPAHFGVGLEAVVLVSEGADGLRGGPVITTKVGQLGYRTSTGKLSKSSGPWAALRYNPNSMIQTYLNTSISEYSWDEVSLTDGTIVTANAGARFTPKQWQWMTVGAEYQYYKTPQLTSDKRALANVEFRFSTGGAK